MEYKFSDVSTMQISIGMSLSDIDALRKLLVAVQSNEQSGMASWRVRRYIRALAEAQAKAAEVLAYEAKALAETAKLDDTF